MLFLLELGKYLFEWLFYSIILKIKIKKFFKKKYYFGLGAFFSIFCV